MTITDPCREYIFIPDLHARADKLIVILNSLNITKSQGRWLNPSNYQLVFLGDLIDNGHSNLRVIATVRELVKEIGALCIMGNHELNAILYYHNLREHSPKNREQHKTFLDEIENDAELYADTIDWFASLPLYYEFENAIAVHASWSRETVRKYDIKSGCPISSELLLSLHDEETHRHVVELLKGTEIDLPAGVTFKDIYGHERTSFRYKWWNKGWDGTLQSIAASLPPNSSNDDIVINESNLSLPTNDESKLIFFGHYKLDELELNEKYICLDLPSKNCFYKLGSNEDKISENNVFFV